jgi:hypothetical protein
MLDEKTSVYDGDVRGFLIYRSNKYIFQSSIAIDKRMTIAQRESAPSLQNRLRLDVSVMKGVFEKNARKSSLALASASASTSSSASASASSSTNKLTWSKGGVVEHIMGEVDDIIKGMATQGIILSKYKQFIIDSVIDQVPFDIYVRLMEELAIKYNSNDIDETTGECLKSVLDAGVLVLTSNKITHFYNYFDGEIYCLRSSNDFKKCTPLEYSKVSIKGNTLKSKMTNDMVDTIKGHTDVMPSTGACNFKVRDNPKSSGYVCLKTSSLSLSDLKDRIMVYDASFDLTNKIKKDLCLIYELTLRAQGAKVFKRSITKKLK